MSHKTKTQKRQKKNRSRRQRSRRFFSRKSQRGGSTILSPSNYSNQNNAHISGIGFTDPQGAVTACTGSTSSAAALKGADIFQTIGGVKTPVTVTTGGGLGRRRGRGLGRWNMRRGGSSVHNTNGYSVGGVHLEPRLIGIANNYHNAYDNCRG
jgi:hypothetical protein